MAVTVIPQVTNWTVTPQNGQAGYFTLMNTWLGQSTAVIASLQASITAQNTANSEINALAIEVQDNADIAVAAKDEAVTALATLFAGAIDDTNIATNKTFSNYFILNSLFSSRTEKTTPVDSDIFAIGDSTSSFSLKKLTWANIKTALNLLYVGLTGNQTIAGTKTFSTSPLVPTPTAQDNSTKVATTAYVDGKMVLGTAVNASGTSIDFTGIPSWVKKITVMFNGVSTNGTSNPLIQVGSGSVVTTGYLGAGEQQGTNTAYTNGFGVPYTAAANLYYGSITIMLLSQNTYSASGIIGTTSTCGRTQGSVALSSTLDRIRITTVNGTDTFDAGSINIMYEG